MEQTRKHPFFYYYQLAEILLNTASKVLAVLFAWVMLNTFKLSQSLGVFMSLAWLAQVVSLIIFGQIGDKLPPKTLILSSALLSLLAFVALFFGAESPFVFGVVFIISSIGTILVSPIGNSLVPQLYGEADVSNAFKIRGFVSSINTILAPAISGFIIYFIPQTAILLLCIVLAICAVVLFNAIKIPALTPSFSPITPQKNPKNTLLILLNHPVERLMVAISALANFVITPIISYIIPYKVTEQFRLTAMHMGISEAVFGLGMIVGSVGLLTRLNGVVGKKFATVISVFLVVLGVLVSVMSDKFYQLCVAMFVVGTGVIMFNVNTTAIRCSATPEFIRGKFESSFLAVCIAPIPIGMLLTTFAIQGNFLPFTYALLMAIMAGLGVMMLLNRDIHALYQLDSPALTDEYVRRFPQLYG